MEESGASVSEPSRMAHENVADKSMSPMDVVGGAKEVIAQGAPNVPMPPGQVCDRSGPLLLVPRLRLRQMRTLLFIVITAFPTLVYSVPSSQPSTSLELRTRYFGSSCPSSSACTCRRGM
jgi:hypothetical protein